MVAMVVETTSVERMYKTMKKAKAVVHVAAPRDAEQSVEKKPSKKKKKEEEVVVKVEEAAPALSGDEPVKKKQKKKRKEREEKVEPEAAVKPRSGRGVSVEETLEKVQQNKENAEGDVCPMSGSKRAHSEPLSPDIEQIQEKEKKKKRENKENKDEKREKRKEKQEKKQKQKMGSRNKNVKGNQQTVGKKTEALPSDEAQAAAAPSVPEPVGMQIYWNLSNLDPSVREAASVALVKELIGAQKDYEVRGLGQEEKAAEAVILGESKVEEDGLKDCAPAVQYALRRLVRGVASSREGARQGFALALAAVLGALQSINGAAILKMIDKHLEVTSAMKGQEVRDALLGQLFAYGAVIRSSRVIGVARSVEQQELAKDVTERLLTLAKKKTFLQEAAASVVVELGEKLAGPELLKSVWASAQLTDSLKEGENSIGPETLFLALRFHPKLPNSAFDACTIIPESGNLIDIFEKDHLLRLLPCLKESTSSHPQVHLVWDPLLQILFSEVVTSKPGNKNKRSSGTVTTLETRLATFWSTVVDGSLLTSSHERKHLAMQLLLMFLPKLPASSYIQRILSKNFIQCLLGATAFKENLLFKAAQNCITELCKWAENDDERRIRVVLALQQSSQGKFDLLSKTQSVKGLLAGLTTITGYQSTFQALSRLHLFGETVEDEVFKESSLNTKKQRVPAGDPDGDRPKDVIGDPLQQRWAVDQLRALCQQALGSLPASVVIEELVAKIVPSLTPVQPLKEEDEESVNTLQLTMLQLSSALSRVESGEKKDRLHAMLSLIVQLLFESRLVPNIAVEIASEITMCCKKAFGDLVELEVESQEGEGEEPAFMDVLVDVLLSLLAQPSAPIRAAAEQVFKSFSGDLTSSGLTDLLRIVKKNTQRSRHKAVVEVDTKKEDDDNDDDDILGVEESDEDPEDDASHGSEDIDGNDEDTEAKANEKTIIAAVNQADEKNDSDNDSDSDNEEVDEEKDEDQDKEEISDVDDEAMFRMDKHLAHMLKQRKQGGASGLDDSTDAQIQLVHFKFRVLALLDFFLQKHSGSLLVLTMLPSLLHVFVNSCTTDGNSQVADRVSSILQNKLFKGKQYPKGPEVDQTSLKGLLRKALKLASRSTVKRVSVMAQATCYWIVKVIHGNLKEESDTDVEDMFSAALEDFVVHKKCRLPSSFFKETFTRSPWLGNCLVGAVLEKCVHARTDYLQFEALQLAGTIFGFKNGKFLIRSKQLDASSDILTKALEPHLPSLSKVILHHLKGASSAKASRRIEAIQFCVSALELHQALYPRRSLAKFIDFGSSITALEVITAPPKSKLNYLVVRVRQLLA